MNVIGDVGWDVVVAGQVLGRVYPVNVPPGAPIPPDARWTVVLPPDLVWPIHDIGRAATSKEQAVGDLFRTLRLEPREWDTAGTPIWARW
ncbi:MAG TPA: hypothetical protein VHJ17_13490 [Thermomonospora sp.]|nr:hypothetical protein [Thermomonospora sp.]